MHKHLLAILVLGLSRASFAEPWRLQNEVTPDWLSLWGEARYRVEVMDNTYRALDPGFDQMTSSRLLFGAEVRGRHWFAGAELQDARAWWHDDRTPVGTDDVNAGEFLQAYVGVRSGDVFSEGDELTLRAGRMTLSMGNKRIVARNVYRNTINGFTGVRADWRGVGGEKVQAFYVLPMERLPNNLDREALLDNEIENDQSTSDRVLWGVELAQLPLRGESLWDLYLVGFDESDRPGLPARKRDHLTLGGRAYDTAGTWQWEIEAAWQWGDARASIFSTEDLDHRAGLFHIEVSRGLDHRFEPRVFARYGYATGDSDPTDDEFERFDTLFAARRRDFGLLGLYAPFYYANLHSGAVGFKMKPAPRLAFESSYRPAWLAEKRDVLFGSALFDPSGNSGDFLGHQFDLRVDWEILPGQLAFMGGVAYLVKGEFLEDAPLAPGNGDTVYAVSQLKFFF